MLTLTEFLLARIAEDEAEVGTEVYGHDDSAGPNGLGWAEVGALNEVLLMSQRRAHAEAEAKRRIVDAVSGWNHETVEDCWYSCAATYGTDLENACCDDGREGMGCDCGLDFRVRSVLAPLALPYASTPITTSPGAPSLARLPTRESGPLAT